MKTISFLLLGLWMSFSIISCSGNDDDTSNNNNNGNTTEIVVEGTWKVTLFQEDDSNQTTNYNGYSFDFNANGTLEATNDLLTKVGSWNTGGDDSGNKLNILFPDNDGPFEEISEDWNILTKTNTKIELKHVSGGDGSVDLLTFERN